MKKMISGLLILVILFAAVIINTIYIDNKLSNISDTVRLSLDSHGEDASAALETAYEQWNRMSLYSKIFLRETKAETISELFIENISSPKDNSLKYVLMYQLQSAIDIEKINIASIF